MAQIIDLPIEHVWPIIFRDLSIKDLLNCRLVNKLFKYFTDNIHRINKLIIGQLSYNNYYENNDFYWYYNNKLIEEKDIVCLRCFRSIQKSSIFNLDINLKYLKICERQFKLEEISNLINLQSIEFGMYYRNDNQQILNLNNLKVFVSRGCYVQLNTPQLEKIKIDDINKIKLKSNPESIKHLIIPNYDNKLEIFKNLEIMELDSIYKIPAINNNLLITFKNLKKLKIYCRIYRSSDYWIKNNLIKILNDKIELKREIDIYLKGIKIENINKFNEYLYEKDSNWEFRLNNYDLLDLNLSFIKYLDYSKLERCINNIKNDLPSSFFDKLFTIYEVEVDKVKDINSLNWFLNNLKCLISLEINYDVSLDQFFYNNLPNTIRVLKIKNSENINSDFILKLSKLIKFYTYVDKDLFDLAFKSFLNLRYLNRFKFNYENKEIKIEKYGKYFYLNNDRRSELDYNQLIEECNKIRSK